MNSYYLYVLYLQDVSLRKEERNSEHHTVSKTVKSCSSFLLPNKRPVDHLSSEAVRNSANFWDSATVISAMWVPIVTESYQASASRGMKGGSMQVSGRRLWWWRHRWAVLGRWYELCREGLICGWGSLIRCPSPVLISSSSSSHTPTHFSSASACFGDWP